MAQARTVLLALATALVAGFAASPASACFYETTSRGATADNPNPSKRQRIAIERRQSAWETRWVSNEARRRLRAGKADPAAELSELLVPNVRPLFSLESDCGLMGEMDFADGRETPDSLFRAIVAGSELAGAESREFTRILRGGDRMSFGTLCNSEFRREFAAHLARSLAPAELESAWLFLAPRQRGEKGGRFPYPRLVRFEGDTRVPPIRWAPADRWLSAQVAKALRRKPWARPLSAAMDAFWAKHSARLGDNNQICPGAITEWEHVRQRAVAEMLDERAARRKERDRQP